MSFKPIDSNRDEFRKYLERSGVIEALSKVLINLFHEQDRPENAVDYLRINIGDALKDRDTIDSLKQELAEARREIDELKKQFTSINTVTVQTNTDAGGDAPISQLAATASNTTAENLESQGKIDATAAATLPAQFDNTDNVEAKIGIDNMSVATDKEVIKADNEETTDNNTSNSSEESNEQQQSLPPITAAVVTTNDEDTSNPPKNAE